MDPATTFVSATPVLASLDIEQSVRFYSKLGFTPVHVMQSEYGIIEADTVQIHFWACKDRRIAEATSCRVQVQGIDALYEKCTRLSIVHPNAPLSSRPWGSKEFGILDPDGNLVTFHQHADT